MAGRTRTLRIVGIVLIAVALLIALYAAVVYLGVERGRALREERLDMARASEIATQMAHAIEEVDNGNTALASRRLTWILEQDPAYEAALVLMEAIEAQATRAPQGEAEATPTSPATEGEAEAQETGLAGELQRLEDLVETESWGEAITALVAFQHSYPDYERRRTDELLQKAYMEQGVTLLYGDQIELGIYYLEQAERLGDLPQEVRDQQQWAELYLAGIGYYGVNWDVSLFYFRDLCLAAPFFHDACQRLYEALVAYGDQYAVQREWCPAEALYEEAYRQDASNALSQKLREARDGCAAATPTPSAPISDTAPVTGTQPLNDTIAPFGNVEGP